MKILDNKEIFSFFRFQSHLIAGFFFLIAICILANETLYAQSTQFDRASAKTIKTKTRQILSEPDFAPKKTFWQWLAEKFSNWEGPDFELGTGWKKAILFIITLWAILTLVAILAHLIWTIGLFIKSNPHSRGAPKGLAPVSVNDRSFEDLYKMSHEMANKGAFHEAVSLLMTALLRWLDLTGIIRFHDSKTNGDYLGEYSSSYSGKNEFKNFILMFERSAYGGLQTDSRLYQHMNLLMERIRIDASQSK